jgi:hypothetical protein
MGLLECSNTAHISHMPCAALVAHIINHQNQTGLQPTDCANAIRTAITCQRSYGRHEDAATELWLYALLAPNIVKAFSKTCESRNKLLFDIAATSWCYACVHLHADCALQRTWPPVMELCVQRLLLLVVRLLLPEQVTVTLSSASMHNRA